MLNRDIGQRLRQARLDKKLTLDELQQMTKIQKRYLEAMEAADFEALPGTFYVRAFIRQFAEAVGEDGDELVDIFDGKDLSEPPPPKAPDPIQVSRKEVHEEEGPVKTFWTSLPMIILGLVALTIIIIVTVMMLEDNQTNRVITPPSSAVVIGSSSTSSTVESSESSSSSTEPSTTETSEEEEMELNFAGETNGIVSMTASKVASPAILTFEGTNGTCWIGIQVNGNYIYQYTLSAGDKQTTELPAGTAEAIITLGASDNVSVALNDKQLNFNPNGTIAVKRTINLTLEYAE